MLTTVLLGACAPLAGVLVAGCGETSHQDASEPRGTFTVQVTHASFSSDQAVSRPAQLIIDVRNTGTRALPNAAVSVTSFYYNSNYPNLASRQRPVWLVDAAPGPRPPIPVETVQVDSPGGGVTATSNLWALGRLAPGASRSFVWHLIPVKPGVHTVFYQVYAGLNGKAKAQLGNGNTPRGHFTVDVASRPPATHVNPETGRVQAGAYSPTSP